MRKTCLVLLLLFASAATPASAAPSARSAKAVAVPAQVDSLEVDAVTTYRLEPEAGVIRVTVEATLTNTAPPRQTGNLIETPFYDLFGTAAIGPVVDASADVDGRSLSTSIESSGDTVEFIVVDLAPNLVFGAPQTVSIRYDIPAKPARSDFATRINDAFASWYAVGTGSSGAADIVVDVPERFEVEFTDLVTPTPVVSDGRAVHRLDDLDDSQSFFGVSVRDDESLVKRPTKVDDDEFEIQAWPGDEAWAAFAVDAVDRGVPVLAARTGVDLEGARSIAIAETATPYLYGYAGWFLPEEDRIEIGDELDLQVMLHELSHLWFNGDLFDSRWINEGLAEVVSNDIARSFGEEFLEVEPIDVEAPGAQPLNDWANPGPDEDADTLENYGYRSSYAVMHDLHDEIGADGLRALIEHADARLLAYVGDGDAERSLAPADWRYLYDIAEHVVGSERVAPLFDEFVLDDDQRVEIDERVEALDRYDGLVEVGGEWSPPLEVRRRMTSWEFERAVTAIDEAELLLKSVDGLAADLATRSIPMSPALEASFESADKIDETAALYLGLSGAVPDLVAADGAIADVNPIEKLGLLGSDANDDRAAALAAFAAGDADEAAARASDALSAADGALVAGAVRLLGAFLVALAAVVVARRVRRRGEPTLWDTADEPTPQGEPPCPISPPEH